MKLTEQAADTLLDKLASDDDFRAAFVKDPRRALAGIGHAPAQDTAVAEGAWSCLQVDSLASKEAIQKSRQELRRMLISSQMGHQPISLQARR